MKTYFGAEPQSVNFMEAPDQIRKEINSWVESQTEGKLSPRGSPVCFLPHIVLLFWICVTCKCMPSMTVETCLPLHFNACHSLINTDTSGIPSGTESLELPVLPPDPRTLHMHSLCRKHFSLPCPAQPFHCHWITPQGFTQA